MQHIFLKGMVTVLLLLLVTSLALGQVSVPNQITFQGRLTDASSNPVADGSHTVNFTLWTLSVGGSNVWTENTSQTTSGGLFTHNLGSITAFGAALFENNDSLYLQIQADGQTISPRIRLTSNPYTRLANNIETYGSDGEPNIQTGGVSYGEIWLRDSDASNFLGVNLGAYSNGGALDLHDNVGTTVISLDAGVTGDASAVLLSNAVNSLEMSNEPGIAHSFNTGIVSLTTTTISTDTVTLTVPTSGYVVVTAHAFFTINHTAGTSDIPRAYINTSPGVGDFDNFAIEEYHSSLPTAFDQEKTISLTKVTSVSAGANTYYLNADVFSGSAVIERRHLTAQFFPTSYGTVDNTLASTSKSKDQAGRDLISEVQSITVQEHNARLEAEVAKVKAELEARLQKLEQQLNKNKQAGVEE